MNAHITLSSPVVVWFSSTYQSTLCVHAYAREIVKTVLREE
jgi:hypothetical protein